MLLPPIAGFTFFLFIPIYYYSIDTEVANLKVPWHENFTVFFNINMISPSLPMVPQWLEMVIGVNRALGILLCL